MYFENIKQNEEVFGLVFGKGIVKNIWKNSHYTFEVEYENGQTVPYTEEGSPGWSNQLDFQTVFYKKDIDLMSMDFSATNESLSAKKIIKLRDKKRLLVKCPSGLWQLVSDCPDYVINGYLEAGQLDKFKKSKD